MFGKRSDAGAQQKPVLPVPQTNAPNGDAFAGGAAVPSHIPTWAFRRQAGNSAGRRHAPDQQPFSPPRPRRQNLNPV